MSCHRILPLSPWFYVGYGKRVDLEVEVSCGRLIGITDIARYFAYEETRAVKFALQARGRAPDHAKKPNDDPLKYINDSLAAIESKLDSKLQLLRVCFRRKACQISHTRDTLRHS